MLAKEDIHMTKKMKKKKLKNFCGCNQTPY
jgi:hypothetical protein